MSRPLSRHFPPHASCPNLPPEVRRLRCDHLNDEETPQRRGVIINISFWSAQRPLGNTIYGIAKAATDKRTSDTAVELKPFAVPVISLYPGLVRTESVLAAAERGAFDLATSESSEFIGRVINALFQDPNLMARTGQVLVAAAVAKEFGVRDVDGSSPPALTLADI